MSELRRTVSALCDDTLGRLDRGPSYDRVVAVKERLSEPLRVALAGHVNAGKSTLLNALLGHQVAQTDDEECTQVVTWFRYGHPQRAMINFRDRRLAPRELALEGGRLPASLGVDPEAVESVSVQLSLAVLKDTVLIDTPGLGSANKRYSERTQRMLTSRSQDAAGKADALIYVITQLARDEDQDVMRTFRSQFGGQAASAINTVGVLNKADKVRGRNGADPLAAAASVARRYADDLGTLVTDVVPMVGLLAETSARLDEEDAGALRRLAALDDSARRRLLKFPEDFARVPCPVSPQRRTRLMGMLHPFGLARCIEWVNDGALGASALRSKLEQTSGIDTLRRRVGDTFDPRSETLRAEAALEQLEAVAYSPADGANAGTLSWLRGALDDLRLQPHWHELNEVRAMHQAASAEVDLPAELEQDLQRLIMGKTVDAKLGLRAGSSAAKREQAALAGAQRWRRAMSEWDTKPAVSRIGRVAQRSYTILWEQTGRQARRSSR